jgi:hypothetical protein
MKIELAGNPLLIDRLKQQIGTRRPDLMTLKTKADSRDFSVLEVAITAVVSGAAKVAFDLLTAAIKETWAAKTSQGPIIAKVGEETIEIKTEADLEHLKKMFNV